MLVTLERLQLLYGNKLGAHTFFLCIIVGRREVGTKASVPLSNIVGAGSRYGVKAWLVCIGLFFAGHPSQLGIDVELGTGFFNLLLDFNFGGVGAWTHRVGIFIWVDVKVI